MSNQHPLRVPVLHRGRKRRPGNHGNREPSRTESVSNVNDTHPEPLVRLNPEAEEFVFQPSQPAFYPIYQPIQYYYPVVFVPIPLPQESVQWIPQDVQSNTPPKTPPLEPIREEGEEESEMDTTTTLTSPAEESVNDDDDEKSDERDEDTGKLLSNTRCVYQLDDLLAFRTRPVCQSRPSEFDFTDLLGDRLMIGQTIEAMNNQIEIVFQPPRVVGNRFPRRPRKPWAPRPQRINLSDKRRRVMIPTPEKDKLMKKTRGILNKIAPDKFELLARRLTELLDERVSCYEHLEIVLDSILDVGIDQPGFAEQYVKLLKYLSKHMEGIVSKWDWVKDLGFDPHSIVKDIVRKQGKNKHGSYWVCAALNKEFMQDLVTASGSEVPLPICDIICEFVQDDSKMERTKKRFLGVEKIVGELCKEKLMSKHMLCIEIINPLLRLTHDSSSTWQAPVTAVELEAVCKLLSVCGQLLEGKGEDWLDDYFHALDEESNGLNKRMEFMVMDLSDLRKAKWGNANERVFVPAPTGHWQSPTRMGRSYGHGSISRGRGFSRMKAPNARYKVRRR